MGHLEDCITLIPQHVLDRPALGAFRRELAESPNGEHSELDTSWHRVDLGPALRGEITKPEPTILRRDDGAAAYTAGCVNGLHGDSGDGKSMTAGLGTAQELAAGQHVIWIDFEDPDATTLVERLRDTFGISADVIERQLHYYGLLAPFDDLAVAEIKRCAPSTASPSSSSTASAKRSGWKASTRTKTSR
jgi:hypothetical protein